MSNISGKELGALLFAIHEHESASGDIVYYEEDLLKVLKAIGLPDPEWGECLTVEEFIQKRGTSE
jgi:hypothetical protein